MSTLPTLPVIPQTANKYTRGSLLVLAGSRRYCGAGVLSTLAAEKTGAGYVSLATPGSAAVVARQHLLCSPVIETSEVERIGSFSSLALSEVLEQCPHIDAICCGPGLTVTEDTTILVDEVLQFAARKSIPLLLDADALTILAIHPGLTKKRQVHTHERPSAEVSSELSPLILTPHTGELARLHTSPKRISSLVSVCGAASELALRLSAVVVAKGPTTVITDGTSSTKSSDATPALAKAGTGDVLAGIISSLLAQGMLAQDAALLGVKIHSRAGILAEKEHGRRSVTALDVISALPVAVRAFD